MNSDEYKWANDTPTTWDDARIRRQRLEELHDQLNPDTNNQEDDNDADNLLQCL